MILLYLCLFLTKTIEMNEQTSVFRRGAELGLPMGLYMSTISLCSIFADKLPGLSLVVLIMLFAGPLVVWRFQRRYYREQGPDTEYAALWMLGILMIIYGALITGLLTWCTLTWVRPGYIYEQTQHFIDIYGAMPELKDSELLRVMRQAVEASALPTAIEMVMNMFWVVSFSGCLMSAVTAAFAKLQN